jgi:hypothetical protein
MYVLTCGVPFIPSVSLEESGEVAKFLVDFVRTQCEPSVPDGLRAVPSHLYPQVYVCLIDVGDAHRLRILFAH